MRAKQRPSYHGAWFSFNYVVAVSPPIISIVGLLLVSTKSLILPPRFSSYSIALRGAAIEAGWHVERLSSWRVSESLKTEDVAIFGESLFCAVVADQLSLFLLEPPFQWLAEIPKEFRLRDVTFCNLAEAKGFSERAFFKPADDKCFPAKVYNSGASLPVPEVLPDDTPVLISEPV